MSEPMIEVVAEFDEDYPIEGHFATGDDAADRELLGEIRFRLANGDVWAWASVKITATYDGVTGESGWLGACSYGSERDFRCDGYFEDLRDEAIEDLKLKLQRRAGIEQAGRWLREIAEAWIQTAKENAERKA